MRIVKHAARHTWRWSLRLTLLCTLLTVLLAGTLWVMLPQASRFQDDLARALGDYLQAPVTISQLVGRWDGIHPSVEIRGFTLNHPQSGESLVQFRRAEAVLDLPASLWQRRLVLRGLVLQGGQLSLARTDPGWQLLPGGNSEDSGRPMGAADLQSLLLGMQNLSLELDSLRLALNHRGADDLVFRDLHLALTEDRWERELRLRARPPGASEQFLHAWISIARTADDSAWETSFLVHGNDLDLAPTGHLDGAVDLRLQGQWSETRNRVYGGLTLRHPRLVRNPGAGPLNQLLERLERLETDIDWHRQGSGWHGEITLQGLGDTGKAHWDSQLRLQRQNDDQPLRGELEQFPVELLAALASPWLPQPLANRLPTLGPNGHLSTTRFSVMDTLESLRLTSEFQDLSTQATASLPGLDGLDGTLRWSTSGGDLTLKSHFLTVSGQPLAAPVELALEGALGWQRHPQGITLRVDNLQLENADLSTSLQGTVEIGADDTRLDLRLGVEQLLLDRVPRYLPVTLMKPKLVNWLRRALVAGEVRQGQGILQGRLGDFPFPAGQGVARLELPVAAVTLDYAPTWPPLENGHGTLHLRGRELDIRVDGGNLRDTVLQSARAHIETLGKPPMTITATVDGPASTFMDAVQAGKVPPEVKKQLAKLHINGHPQVTVDVLLPFRRRRPVVSGLVAFRGSDVQLPRYRLPLDQVHGTLRFGPGGLQAQGLSLSLHDRPATLDIESEPLEHGGRRSRFLLAGEPDFPRMLPDPGILGGLLQGRSAWQAEVIVERPEEFQLQLRSTLQGTRLRLPPPLGKSSGQSRPVRVAARVGTSAMDLDLRLEPGLQSTTRWGRNGGLHLERGEVRINTGTARLPDEPGLAVIAHLPTLQPMADQGPETILPERLPAWLRRVDLRLDRLNLGALALPDLQFRLHRSAPEVLAGELAGATAQGRFRVPLGGDQPFQIHLQRLSLPHWKADTGDTDISSAASPALDPSSLPPLDLRVEALEIGGQSWGTLEIRGEPTATGFQLEPLGLASDRQQVTGSCLWEAQGDGHKTHLQLQLKSAALGNTLTELGAHSPLSGGPTDASVDLRWMDSLLRPQLATLDGEMTVTIGPGRFDSLEPGGLGRLLGLISLQGLGRRLSLDFSDVNDQGLGFDSITARVTLDDGVAHTDDLLLTSPAAQVSLLGSVDLVNRSLDQAVYVAPRIGTSLGLAGTLVGGPVVGAAVLAADALLPGGMGQVTQLAYRVSGPWEEPQIQRITTLPPQRNTDPINSITNR